MHGTKDIALWRALRCRSHPIWPARVGVVCDTEEVHGSNQNEGGGVRWHDVITRLHLLKTGLVVVCSSVRWRAFPHLRYKQREPRRFPLSSMRSTADLLSVQVSMAEWEARMAKIAGGKRDEVGQTARNQLVVCKLGRASQGGDGRD